MITIDIKFMMYLESSAELSIGRKGVSSELKEGATFRDLLEGLEHDFGLALAEEIYDPEKRAMRDSVRATLNGVLAHNMPGGLDTVLQHGDAVIFVPLLAGG